MIDRSDFGKVPENRVKCLICGSEYKALSSHINNIHKISSQEYREKFGIKKGELFSLEMRKRATNTSRDTYYKNELVRKSLRDGTNIGIIATKEQSKTEAGRKRLKEISDIGSVKRKEYWSKKENKEKKAKELSIRKKLYWNKVRGDMKYITKRSYGAYQVDISNKKNKHIYIGTFNTLKEAKLHRNKAIENLGKEI